MQTDNILSQHVETARQKLHDLQNKYGFGHPSVLKQSMVLDELINQYQYTYYRRKKKPTV
ncbi:aspartyl-phosphate phosphatase Spo0E family protein [Paenibacillus sp. 1-18]|uniref:aspartyl-phosphate phosphatase Spo0E family protein n=1 Tax=Paenibacillus sp. 1-18 TaxID=1333846 RepID=UPI00047040E9|nr:aspartyl-phosphate phosphatase Spo0E family protein [Paenibacillus sp. 1-18]